MKKNAVILQKPSGTIAVRVDINALQRKFYNALLFFAKKELKKKPDKKIFFVKLTAIKGLLNKGEQDKNNVYYIEKIIELMSKTAEYNLFEKDKIIVRDVFVLLPRVKIMSQKGDEVEIGFELTENVRESLLKPFGMFASINLVVIAGLKSKYAIILYELIKDYINVEIPRMSLEKLRQIFGVEKKHKLMANLRNKVLDVAVNGINESESVELRVSYMLFKSGKKYTDIKFSIAKKPAIKKLPAAISDRSGSEGDGPNFRPELRAGFENLKGLKMLAEQSLRENGREYTERNITYANNFAKSNYPAFLKKAISEDWAATKVAASADTAKTEKEKHKKILERFLRMQIKTLQSLAEAGNIYAQEALAAKEKK